jgi:hypothetical protein
MNSVTPIRPSSSTSVSPASHWPLERVLFAMAGTMTLVSAVLAAVVSPWFLILTAFVGLNQWMYVAFRGCPASVVLKRFGVAPQCRW